MKTVFHLQKERDGLFIYNNLGPFQYNDRISKEGIPILRTRLSWGSRKYFVAFPGMSAFGTTKLII